MSDQVVTRFAPSPTGDLHMGGLRTALFSYVLAKHHHGKFYLRIEDTDYKRCQEGSSDAILSALQWCGLQWDGEVIYQSDRLALYSRYAHMLLSKGLAYRCFCSEERLEEVRKKHMAQGLRRGYDGHCRHLSSKDMAAHIKQLKPYVIRLKLPKQGDVHVEDALRGTIQFPWQQLEDFIILKADGFPTYHLAHVVDDALCKVTHVLRGSEWISTLPVHDFILQGLGWPSPVYVHLPLILDSEGGKLSKRKQAVSVQAFQDQGYLKEAVINFLALLGWSYDDKTTLFSLDELIKQFSIGRVSKSAAEFSVEKLDYFNHHYLVSLPPVELRQRLAPFLKKAFSHLYRSDHPACAPESMLAQQTAQQRAENLASLYVSRLKHLSELESYLAVLLSEEPMVYEAAVWQHKKLNHATSLMSLEAMIALLDGLQPWTQEHVEASLKELALKHDWKVFTVMMPLRIALTASQQSPSSALIAYYLGQEESVKRLKAAYASLQAQNLSES
ncbi:MAG: glutamate--tRNA ligase [Proteobacteria bacterium]|nr:glutamate--tRNA ligase [Pseudomonadota bacterium]